MPEAFVWFGRVEVYKRRIAIAIGCAESVELCQRDGLDDIEAFGLAIIEIRGDLRQGETVKQLPSRVAQPEEGSAVLVLQVVVVGGDLQAAVGPGGWFGQADPSMSLHPTFTAVHPMLLLYRQVQAEAMTALLIEVQLCGNMMRCQRLVEKHAVLCGYSVIILR